MMSLKFRQPTYLPNSALYTFRCRELISVNQDILWQIDTGVVRTSTWDREGNSIALGFWGVGEVVGQSLPQIRPYQIESLTAVKAYALPSNTQIDRQVLLSHIQQTEELLTIMHCISVEQRLLQFLLWFADKFGGETEEGKSIKLRLTHQILAEAIGTSRVTVTRLLGKFQRQGIVSWSPQRFLNINP
jgi:CRP-like cAMP-binding protein